MKRIFFITIILLQLLLIGNINAQKNLSIDSAFITGKYNIPDFPQWVNNAVFYQIYPQTFYDSNGDGIGDLNGIIEKLDYVKSLGVDGIWINPFFESPFHDAGYDVSNYYKVSPRYGTNDDAKRMFAEAKKRGIKIIFDYVISYTSIDNPWFRESAKHLAINLLKVTADATGSLCIIFTGAKQH
ncbi:MAG: alpha-amylase family glycosyl hydrolase [Ignavibacteriaceae bacterium]